MLSFDIRGFRIPAGSSEYVYHSCKIQTAIFKERRTHPAVMLFLKVREQPLFCPVTAHDSMVRNTHCI